MATNDLTAQRLRELLHYDPETGLFTWLVRTSNRVRVGDVAGSIMLIGYRTIMVDGVPAYAHRLAWLHVHGSWPTNQLDHINGNRADNRIANLRDVSGSINNQNKRAAMSYNSTGLLGVCVAKRRHCVKYEARIKTNGVTTTLGVFETPELAHAAYLDAKRVRHEGCQI